MAACASAEPRLSKWLLPTQKANISSSTYSNVLGHIPPTDIQNNISSFKEESPLDAIDILATSSGKSFLDRTDVNSFLVAVNRLPLYLQDHIILTYPHALKFAQTHLRVA